MPSMRTVKADSRAWLRRSISSCSAQLVATVGNLAVFLLALELTGLKSAASLHQQGSLR